MARTGHRALPPLLAVSVVVLTALAACIDNTVDPELAEVDFLVGSWAASRMVMISAADPDRVVDLAEVFDATFTLDVNPSGRYTAKLTLGGGTPLPPETGSLSVEGDSLVFADDKGPVSRSHFDISDDGRLLVLEGPAEFDFDGDFVAEPAVLRLELDFL